MMDNDDHNKPPPNKRRISTSTFGNPTHPPPSTAQSQWRSYNQTRKASQRSARDNNLRCASYLVVTSPYDPEQTCFEVSPAKYKDEFEQIVEALHLDNPQCSLNHPMRCPFSQELIPFESAVLDTTNDDSNRGFTKYLFGDALPVAFFHFIRLGSDKGLFNGTIEQEFDDRVTFANRQSFMQFLDHNSVEQCVSFIRGIGCKILFVSGQHPKLLEIDLRLRALGVHNYLPPTALAFTIDKSVRDEIIGKFKLPQRRKTFDIQHIEGYSETAWPSSLSITTDTIKSWLNGTTDVRPGVVIDSSHHRALSSNTNDDFRSGKFTDMIVVKGIDSGCCRKVLVFKWFTDLDAQFPGAGQWKIHEASFHDDTRSSNIQWNCQSVTVENFIPSEKLVKEVRCYFQLDLKSEIPTTGNSSRRLAVHPIYAKTCNMESVADGYGPRSAYCEVSCENNWLNESIVQYNNKALRTCDIPWLTNARKAYILRLDWFQTTCSFPDEYILNEAGFWPGNFDLLGCYETDHNAVIKYAETLFNHLENVIMKVSHSNQFLT